MVEEKPKFYMGVFVDVRKGLEERLAGHQKGTQIYSDIKKDLDIVNDKLCMFYGVLDYCFKQEWINHKEPYNAYIEQEDEKDKMFVWGNDMSGNYVERSFMLSE